MKRQAARFRVYAFDEADNVLCEATPDKGFKTEWKVQVANRKASWYAFMGKHEPGAFQPGNSTLRNPNVQSEVRASHSTISSSCLNITTQHRSTQTTAHVSSSPTLSSPFPASLRPLCPCKVISNQSMARMMCISEKCTSMIQADSSLSLGGGILEVLQSQV